MQIAQSRYARRHGLGCVVERDLCVLSRSWLSAQEQWRAIAERAPDDATADYLHQVFEPTARAIDGLEKALAGLGLLDQALTLARVSDDHGFLRPAP